MWQCPLVDLLYYGFFALFAGGQDYTPPPPSGAEFSLHSGLSFDLVVAQLMVVLVFPLELGTLLDIVYRRFSVAAITVGIIATGDRPPLFGDIQDAYTLRKLLWGNSKCFQASLVSVPSHPSRVFMASGLAILALQECTRWCRSC